MLNGTIGRRFWLQWVLTNTLGRATGSATGNTIGMWFGSNPRGWVLSSAVLGVSIGLAQWFVLRRWVSRSGWWILASTVGCAVGFTAGMNAQVIVFGVLEAAGFEVSFALGLGVFGAVSGCTTGGVLAWLLRRSISDLEPGQHYPRLS